MASAMYVSSCRLMKSAIFKSNCCPKLETNKFCLYNGSIRNVSGVFAKKDVEHLKEKAKPYRTADNDKNQSLDGTEVIKKSAKVENSTVVFRRNIRSGPSLESFFVKCSGSVFANTEHDEKSDHPYVNKQLMSGKGRKVYFEIYGCQMNVNDTEIAWSILQRHGFVRTNNIKLADVILVMTCSIREGAEQKVWNLLEHLKALKRKREDSGTGPPLKIGILGCMAEHLKERLIEKEKAVDLVAGPDSYRDLPRMLAFAEDGHTAVNVILSMDETYADVTPIRLNEKSRSAFVSIMRGCDNMCSYCIVPFTRGKERSRSLSSIVDEIKHLSDQGLKEVVLLGQNVNSYRDISVNFHRNKEPTTLSGGFSTVYKPKLGGLRFADLLDKVSNVNPEIRIRFTSPHPKDFPDEVLQIMKERPNICKQIHLPAQSGNNTVLEQMRRGYTREAYLDLVFHIRSVLPDVALTSDFICGFCGETEEQFEETLTLIQEVKYNFAYVFSYSMRGKTKAYHRMVDNVSPEVKRNRLERMIKVFRTEAEKLNRLQIGSQQLILVESPSKRSASCLAGRNDQNTRVIFSASEIPVKFDSFILRDIQPGDYVVVQINDANSQVLKGIPLYHTTLQDHQAQYEPRYYSQVI